MTADRSEPCRITWRRDWAPHLFSIRAERPAGLAFAPGQFVRIGLVDSALRRAYSIASAPADDQLEFYSIVVPDGPFTQPFARLGVGDSISVDPTVYGFLRTDRFDGGRHLWLLATGTGIAPFRSMLADAAVWSRFEQIVLVHSVRTEAELAYRDDFERWSQPSAGRARLTYLPTLTGAPMAGALHGRIPALIHDGTLERASGCTIAPADSRLMLCGNPSMIKEARALLAARGMTPVRRETPGQFIVENFW